VDSRSGPIAFLILVAVVAAGCGNSPSTTDSPDASGLRQSTGALERTERPTVAVEIRETDRDLPGLFEDMRALGVNTVFASEELTSFGGFRALAKKNGTDLYIVFPVFLAPEALDEDSDLRAITASGKWAKADSVEFACPSRANFRERRSEDARAVVKRLRPEGLSIDLFSHFMLRPATDPDRNYGMLPNTCYCVHCLQAFATFLGVPIFSIPPQPQRAAAWIDTNAADAWTRFRAETITSVAEEITEAIRDIDPEILINIGIVSWLDNSDGGIARATGQDAVALSKIADSLSPMAYPFMPGRPPEWVASVVQDLDRSVDCRVLPSIQLSANKRGVEDFSSAEMEAILRAALSPPSAGVVFRTWNGIESDPKRAAIIRQVVGQR